MAKQKLRDIGMDVMERLYYERKEARQKAYAAKKRKAGIKASIKDLHKNPVSDSYDKTLIKAI